MGTQAWVTHLKTPDLGDEDINSMVENPRSATDESLRSRIALYELVVGCDGLALSPSRAFTPVRRNMLFPRVR